MRRSITDSLLAVSLIAATTFAGILGCSKNKEESADQVVQPAATADTAPSLEQEVNVNAAANEPQELNESETVSGTPISDVAVAPEGKVLRHAVFFSFKDESSEEDVTTVVDTFRSLPAKIDAIQDFGWGTNNSPEGLDDGFTHCFFLTFKDQAGLQEYIPHPAHSEEFANTLRPHMKDVFVIDYWGTPPESNESNRDDSNTIEPGSVEKRELKHAVFFKFKDDADPAAVKTVEDAFAALPSKIDAIKAFEWGINNSPEGKNDQFTHAFMVTFASEKGREEYLPHPDHLAFVEVLKPVLDKVRVLDFWIDK